MFVEAPNSSLCQRPPSPISLTNMSLCGQTVPAADAAEESTKAAVEQVKASPQNATIGELANHIVRTHGIVGNHLIEDVLATWPGAVQLASGRPRHPQSQGLVEQAHYTLERIMSSRIAESASINSPPWTHWLPHIVYTINAQVHRPTKHTPFELVLGQPPRSVVVPDARLKGLINEEDLELTGEMESAQDTSDVERTILLN
eukprot:Em0001g3396a